MPQGKPAGVRCIQLTEENLCRIFDTDARPRVCNSYTASSEFCGGTREEALRILTGLEQRTSRDSHDDLSPLHCCGEGGMAPR